jgi:hypothetical protein
MIVFVLIFFSSYSAGCADYNEFFKVSLDSSCIIIIIMRKSRELLFGKTGYAQMKLMKGFIRGAGRAKSRASSFLKGRCAAYVFMGVRFAVKRYWRSGFVISII